ncbi:MAG: peptide deformylase [Candidatus Woesearchaeota archaeon]|nr:peptide deformylase [Candidatus Woesearchaeota archaeon]
MHTVADVCQGMAYAKWVRTKAKELDLNSELNSVTAIGNLLYNYRMTQGWLGVSSSNVFIRELAEPLAIIQIPLKYDNELAIYSNYATIANPKIKSCSTDLINTRHRCGSVPGPITNIPFFSDITIQGYHLEHERYAEIELNSHQLTAIAWHEIEHLKGNLHLDYSQIIGFYNSWMDELFEYALNAESKGSIVLELRFDPLPYWQEINPHTEKTHALYGRPIRATFPNSDPMRHVLGMFGSDPLASCSFTKLPVYWL